MRGNMNNNNGQWQQPPQGMPPQGMTQQNVQWQQGMPQQGMPQQGIPPQNGQWQQTPPPPGMPPQNGYYYSGMYGMRPPKKNNTGIIVVIIIIALALAAGGVCAFGYFKLGWFRVAGESNQEPKVSKEPEYKKVDEADWGKDRSKETYSADPENFKIEIESSDGKTAERVVLSGVGDVTREFYINISDNLKDPEYGGLRSSLGWYADVGNMVARVNIPTELRGCEGKIYVKDMLVEYLHGNEWMKGKVNVENDRIIFLNVPLEGTNLNDVSYYSAGYHIGDDFVYNDKVPVYYNGTRIYTQQAEIDRLQREQEQAEENRKRNAESYARLKEQWDEASRQQQERVDEIMSRYRNDEEKQEADGGQVPSEIAGTREQYVDGRWYGPETVSGQTVISLRGDGTMTVTFDLGAGDSVTYNGTYTTDKRQYEYDDFVCHVTLSGDTSYLPSNRFTFVIDPEIDWSAVFVEGGFGLMGENTSFYYKY